MVAPGVGSHEEYPMSLPRCFVWLPLPLCLLLAVLVAPFTAPADVVIKDVSQHKPLVLDQPENYVLKNVRVTGVKDGAALSLRGTIRSLSIENGKFGDITAGENNKAAAMESVGASVGSLRVTDTAFYDAQNQLVSLRDGSFGSVTFLHCSFKNSEAFLKRIYTANSWRTTPPVTEFYNIDRLELLDNDFANTTIIIHPSVKTVVLRGDVSKLTVESPGTQVIHLNPGEKPPFRIPGADSVVLALAPRK